MKYLFSFLLFLAASSSAQADEYGPFLCGTGCTFAGAIGVPPDGETQLFIGEVVNNYDDGQYEVGDTVVICNGTTCATYRFSGFSFRLVSRVADSGGPYWNTRPVGSGGSGGNFTGSGGYSFGVVGFRPIYMTGYVTVNGVTYAQEILVGWEPIYGSYRNQAL
ncbi:MAG: hypothetical protein NT046_09370 [Arenimonas sp.]|nr:hypothetical protein [Arenimonas sp.]